MGKPDYPITPAIRVLRQKKADFTPFQYDYEEKGGTVQTASKLNVDEHSVIKTLIMEDENKTLYVVLMHGDKEVSTKNLARQLNVKKMQAASADTASKATGYQFGGTSPFGTKKSMQVLVEKTILDIDKIYINGGKRGFIISIEPKILKQFFKTVEVEVGI